MCANPVNNLPSAQLPTPTQPIVDPATGIPTPLYHRFQVGLFLRTGGAAGANTTDVQTLAEQAESIANSAAAEATLAKNTANSAVIAADAAQTTANTAATSAQNANTLGTYLNKNALLAANDLSDVSNVSASRANLGLNVFPLTVTFDTLTTGLTRYVPLVSNLTIPANFARTSTYCGTVPTADAVFTVSYIRGPLTTPIGTITLIHLSVFNALSIQAPVNLLSGDTLVIQCPSPADATLAHVGITIYMSLT